MQRLAFLFQVALPGQASHLLVLLLKRGRVWGQLQRLAFLFQVAFPGHTSQAWVLLLRRGMMLGQTHLPEIELKAA